MVASWDELRWMTFKNQQFSEKGKCIPGMLLLDEMSRPEAQCAFHIQKTGSAVLH